MLLLVYRSEGAALPSENILNTEKEQSQLLSSWSELCPEGHRLPVKTAMAGHSVNPDTLRSWAHVRSHVRVTFSDERSAKPRFQRAARGRGLTREPPGWQGPAPLAVSVGLRTSTW